jgi:hypothetical protein
MGRGREVVTRVDGRLVRFGERPPDSIAAKMSLKRSRSNSRRRSRVPCIFLEFVREALGHAAHDDDGGGSCASIAEKAGCGNARAFRP